VAGYSRLTGMDEEGTHAQLRDHLRSLVDPKIAEHREHRRWADGRVQQRCGAVRRVLEIQRGMAERVAKYGRQIWSRTDDP